MRGLAQALVYLQTLLGSKKDSPGRSLGNFQTKKSGIESLMVQQMSRFSPGTRSPLSTESSSL